MKLFVDVQFRNVNYSFSLLNGCDSCRLELCDVFIIDVFKIHNHLYRFKSFFYHNKKIYSYFDVRSKTELYIAIQKLLQEELSNV